MGWMHEDPRRDCCPCYKLNIQSSKSRYITRRTQAAQELYIASSLPTIKELWQITYDACACGIAIGHMKLRQFI